jgi:hypothetical protein
MEKTSLFIPVSKSLLLRKDNKILNIDPMSNRYHSEHCLFQWRKLQYGMHNRVEFLDNKTVSLGNSGHRADQLSGGTVRGYWIGVLLSWDFVGVEGQFGSSGVHSLGA